MKRTIARRLVVALSVLLMAGGLAIAQGPGGSGMGPGFGDRRPPMERAFQFDGAHGRFWNNPRVITALKLTDDQRKAMDEILQEHRVTLIDLRANVEKAEVAMEPLIRADEPNETAILTQIDKIAQARAELEKANARFLLAIRSKLTPDQWKQVQAFRATQETGDRWGRDGQGPGMAGHNGQFHRQGPPPQPPADQQQGAPPPQAPGTGDPQ